MLSLIWVRGLARRRTARLAGQALGVALAVLMLTSLGMFFASSRAHMTEQAVAAVPVDWQVQLASGADPTKALPTIVVRRPASIAAVPVGFADTPGFPRDGRRNRCNPRGTGKVLGLPASYAATFPGEIRFLLGARTGVLARAAGRREPARDGRDRRHDPNVRASPPVHETVAGIVDLPYADSLFQTIGAPAGAAPTAPPDNVMLLPIAEWHRVFDRAQGGSDHTQVHVALSPALPSDPEQRVRRRDRSREEPRGRARRRRARRQQHRRAARRGAQRRRLRAAAVRVPRVPGSDPRGAADGRRGRLGSRSPPARAGAAPHPRRDSPADRRTRRRRGGDHRLDRGRPRDRRRGGRRALGVRNLAVRGDRDAGRRLGRQARPSPGWRSRSRPSCCRPGATRRR